jgi:hypothetical protein
MKSPLNLAVCDRLFRTFTPTRRAFDVVYGLEDVEPARSKSLSGLLTMPFAAAQSDPSGRASLDRSSAFFHARLHLRRPQHVGDTDFE